MGRQYARLLDRFYLPHRPDPAVSAVLFDMLADRYDELVDTAQNALNTVGLVRKALAALPHPGSLKFLDFGCGTGLSVQALEMLSPEESEGIDMLGTDCSSEMLSLARQRGLRTVEFSSWKALPSESFDAIIASYVFHCGLEDEELEVLARQLRARGVLVGNYHHATKRAMAHLTRQARASGLQLGPIYPCQSAAASNPVLTFAKGRCA